MSKQFHDISYVFLESGHLPPPPPPSGVGRGGGGPPGGTFLGAAFLEAKHFFMAEKIASGKERETASHGFDKYETVKNFLTRHASADDLFLLIRAFQAMIRIFKKFKTSAPGGAKTRYATAPPHYIRPKTIHAEHVDL